MTPFSELIQNVVEGRDGARDELFAAAYPDLRRLARSRLHNGGRNAMLETTALVHECYLRFLGSRELHLRDRQALLDHPPESFHLVGRVHAIAS